MIGPGTRARWAAIGAAVAVTLGGGGIAVTNAAINSGERAAFVPIVPCRLFDTRSTDAVGPRATPLGAGEIFTQQVTGANGQCNIPTDAIAVAMNVTAVGGTSASFLTVYPADAPSRPLASNLNWAPGASPTPNKVDVKLSLNGAIKLFNSAGSVNVLADVVGYYADHNHDDRYANKLVTEVFGPEAMSWESPSVVTAVPANGCVTNSTSSGVYAIVPVVLPVGGRLISVDVVVRDTAGPTTYSVDLIRTIVNSAGATTVHLGFISNLGSQAALVHTPMVPASTEIAGAEAHYYVRVGSFQNNANAFCQVTVTYDANP